MHDLFGSRCSSQWYSRTPAPLTRSSICSKGSSSSPTSWPPPRAPAPRWEPTGTTRLCSFVVRRFARPVSYPESSHACWPAGLSYIQTVETDRRRNQNRWTLSVERVGERVQIGGIEQVEASGDGCQVTIVTEVNLRVPVIGRKVEQAVRREIERVYRRRLEVIVSLHRAL